MSKTYHLVVIWAKMKRFWLVLVIVIASMVGILVFGGRDTPPPASSDDPFAIGTQDHVKGEASAKATLIEYGDFECPACGAFYPLFKQLEEEYGGRVRFVFRHFPISSIHPNAFAGARAAVAAGAQGKFFAMHDLLYERQKDWSKNPQAISAFRDYASELGLDTGKFNDDYNSQATADRINSDIQVAKELGVNSTPTLYLNGQKIEPNPRTYQELKAKIEAILSPSALGDWRPQPAFMALAFNP